MSEAAAKAIADATGGETWQSGGGIWLAMCRRTDGALIVFSSDAICEYADEDSFDQGQPRNTIQLA